MVHIVWETCTLYGKCVRCMGSVYIVWETCKFVRDVHIVWEVCTLYGKCVHCMGSVYIVWEVCTLYGKCVHCMGNVQIFGRRAHYMGSVYIVWETCSFYESDNNHFTIVTITFINTQYRLFRLYKSGVWTKEVILRPIVNARYEQFQKLHLLVPIN